MPAAVAIPALISGGTSVLGGILGSNAAKNAAATQAEAQTNAGHAIDKATGQAIASGYTGLSDANKALDEARSNSLKELDQGKGEANQFSHDVYQQEREGLDPYLNAGKQGVNTLAGMLAPGGELTKDFQWDPATDPGYQFRLKEGLKELQNSASVSGGVRGGAAEKAIARYSQDYASSEYGKSFDRFQQNRKNKYDMESGLAGYGERANGQAIVAGNNYMDTVNGNDMGAAKLKAGIEEGTGSEKARTDMQGNEWVGAMGLHGADTAQSYYTGAANSRAGGATGSANAWTGMLRDLGKVGGGFDWSKIFGPKVGGTLGQVPDGVDAMNGVWP